MTEQKYTLEDVGCYLDLPSEEETLNFFMTHGFTYDPIEGTPDTNANYWEEMSDLINEGLDYLNDKCCDETVYFTFDAGDLVLFPLGD